ncbi:MAG: hypothetical protein AAFQ75_00110 [Pseudomonadota bacterium]
MFRTALCLILPLLFLAGPSDARASAADYEACAADAGDKRSLRRCNTFKSEVAECNERRSGGGVDAPVDCLGPKLEAWRAVMESEEERADAAGIEPKINFEAWVSRTFGWCRDAEQIRLSTERYGAPFAEFEALSCELRAVIRRTLQRTKDLKGL